MPLIEKLVQSFLVPPENKERVETRIQEIETNVSYWRKAIKNFLEIERSTIETVERKILNAERERARLTMGKYPYFKLVRSDHRGKNAGFLLIFTIKDTSLQYMKKCIQCSGDADSYGWWVEEMYNNLPTDFRTLTFSGILPQETREIFRREIEANAFSELVIVTEIDTAGNFLSRALAAGVKHDRLWYLGEFTLILTSDVFI